MGLWTGIRRHGAGWRATVSQGRGNPRLQKHYPLQTDPKIMQAWRATAKAGSIYPRKPRANLGSFEADAKRYLDTVTALPTIQERRREIALWVSVLGPVDRAAITSADIRRWRDRWLTEPRDPADPKSPPLAPGTVNKRLRALSNLYRVLDGSQAYNPVRDVPEAKEPAPEAKGIDYGTVAAILAELPDAGRPKKGQKRGTVSKTKIRLYCLAYCPIAPKQLMKLTPADLDLERGWIRLPARVKGRGAKAVWQPLLPAAWAAFKVFHVAQCYGPFSGSSLRKSFKSAARRAGVPEKVWPYRLRHAFGTLAYQATGSLEAVGALMQHADKSTTLRYALGAQRDVLTANMARVAQQYGATEIGDSRKLSETLGGFERPLKPLPTHHKGGNPLGRPRKSKDSAR